MRGTGMAMVAVLLLASCGGEGQGLRRFSGTTGPDEFSVQPSRPLELPPTTALPVPGGGNRADVTPAADAIALLGGNPGAAFAGGIPASDQALIAQVAAGGTDPAIRATLAAEDAAFRGGARLGGLFNIFGRDRYFRAYASQALDAHAELARFRALGLAVPSAPPLQ